MAKPTRKISKSTQGSTRIKPKTEAGRSPSGRETQQPEQEANKKTEKRQRNASTRRKKTRVRTTTLPSRKGKQGLAAPPRTSNLEIYGREHSDTVRSISRQEDRASIETAADEGLYNKAGEHNDPYTYGPGGTITGVKEQSQSRKPVKDLFEQPKSDPISSQQAKPKKTTVDERLQLDNPFKTERELPITETDSSLLKKEIRNKAGYLTELLWPTQEKLEGANKGKINSAKYHTVKLVLESLGSETMYIDSSSDEKLEAILTFLDQGYKEFQDSEGTLETEQLYNNSMALLKTTHFEILVADSVDKMDKTSFFFGSKTEGPIAGILDYLKKQKTQDSSTVYDAERVAIGINQLAEHFKKFTAVQKSATVGMIKELNGMGVLLNCLGSERTEFDDEVFKEIGDSLNEKHETLVEISQYLFLSRVGEKMKTIGLTQSQCLKSLGKAMGVNESEQSTKEDLSKALTYFFEASYLTMKLVLDELGIYVGLSSLATTGTAVLALLSIEVIALEVIAPYAILIAVAVVFLCFLLLLITSYVLYLHNKPTDNSAPRLNEAGLGEVT